MASNPRRIVLPGELGDPSADIHYSLLDQIHQAGRGQQDPDWAEWQERFPVDPLGANLEYLRRQGPIPDFRLRDALFLAALRGLRHQVEGERHPERMLRYLAWLFGHEYQGSGRR